MSGSANPLPEVPSGSSAKHPRGERGRRDPNPPGLIRSLCACLPSAFSLGAEDHRDAMDGAARNRRLPTAPAAGAEPAGATLSDYSGQGLVRGPYASPRGPLRPPPPDSTALAGRFDAIALAPASHEDAMRADRRLIPAAEVGAVINERGTSVLH